MESKTASIRLSCKIAYTQKRVKQTPLMYFVIKSWRPLLYASMKISNVR